MSLREAHRNPPDSEEPGSFLRWEDYSRRDARPVSDYLFERGDRVSYRRTVETRQYTAQDFFDHEAERLWATTWQMACRTNDIPNVGDYLEYEIVGRSILIVRDAPGSIRAFHNACRHRGTALAAGCGNRRQFVCPFHGWTFACDGTLQHIPAAWDFPGLDRAEYGLRSCHAETFDGWVFVNLDEQAQPLRDFLGETITRHLLVHPSEPFWKAYHFGMVVPCNWKIMAEAFFETYHIPRTHPTIVSWGSDLQTQYDAFGLHARLLAPAMVPSVVAGGEPSEQEILEEALGFSGARTGESFDSSTVPHVPEGMTARQFMAEMVRAQWATKGVDLNQVSDSEVIDGILYLVFPNFMPFRNPAGHVAYRFRPNGCDPHSSIFEVMNLLPVPEGQDRPPDAPLRMLAPDEKFASFSDQMGVMGFLLDQDVSNSGLIQKGLRSLDHIVLAERQEQNIVAFHHNLERVLGLDEGGNE